MAKKKTDVMWLRFKFTDDAKTRAEVISAADRMFRKIGGILERRRYTEEEVADAMKRAILQAEADTASSGNPVRTLRERT